MKEKGSIRECLFNIHMQRNANDQHERAHKESRLKWQHSKILVSNNRIHDESVQGRRINAWSHFTLTQSLYALFKLTT